MGIDLDALSVSRRRAARFVEAPPVQRFVLWVIVVNGLTLGLETSPWMQTHLGGLLHVLDVIALVIFVIEILLKLYAYRWRFFTDGWNVFDFIVVGIALVPAAGPFSVLRSLRILRLLRIINRMPQLRRVVTALLRSLPGLGAIAGLTALVFYIGATMATALFGEQFPQWFGDLGKSLYSLFQVMTLESWSMGIVRPVMEVYPHAWAFFVPFILASAFTMLNLFVAVIVDAMQTLHETSTDVESGDDPAHHTRPEGIATQSHQEEILAELAALRSQVAALDARLSTDPPQNETATAT
ncbi:ion transporter [Microbacterium sp.]|uniref:ion transporter n=1 Tax=Microbacterium sp. TaxID=51671 RepID=UPI003A8683B7